MKKAILTILTIGIIISLYAYFVEPKMLKTNEIAITNEQISNTLNGLKIVHFSD